MALLDRAAGAGPGRHAGTPLVARNNERNHAQQKHPVWMRHSPSPVCNLSGGFKGLEAGVEW
jgi:hypothetical protein